jgi:hypothetical protein
MRPSATSSGSRCHADIVKDVSNILLVMSLYTQNPTKTYIATKMKNFLTTTSDRLTWFKGPVPYESITGETPVDNLT